MDRFPEAFNRWEETHDLDDYDTLDDLLFSFRRWGKNKFIPTYRQRLAMEREAMRRGFREREPEIEYVPEPTPERFYPPIPEEIRERPERREPEPERVEPSPPPRVGIRERIVTGFRRVGRRVRGFFGRGRGEEEDE